MTIREFNDEITSWWDLKDFCDEHGISKCDDVYSSDQVDDYLNDRLWDKVHSDSWMEVRDWLSGFDESYTDGCYRIDDYEEITYLDDDYDFPEYKQAVLEIAAENGVFDNEDEDSDLESEEECELEESPFEAADFPVEELYEESSAVLSTIQKESCEEITGAKYILSNEIWL